MADSDRSLNIFSSYKDSFLQTIKLVPKMLFYAFLFYLPYVILKMLCFAKGITLLPFDLEKIFFAFYFNFFVVMFCADYLAEKEISFKAIFTKKFNFKILKNFAALLTAGILFFSFSVAAGGLFGVIFALFTSVALPMIKEMDPSVLGVVLKMTGGIIAFLVILSLFILISGCILLYGVFISFIPVSIACNDLSFTKIFTYNFTLVKNSRYRLIGISVLNTLIMMLLFMLPLFLMRFISSIPIVYTSFDKWLPVFSLEIALGIILNVLMSLFYVRIFLRLEELNSEDSPLFTGEEEIEVENSLSETENSI